MGKGDFSLSACHQKRFDTDNISVFRMEFTCIYDKAIPAGRTFRNKCFHRCPLISHVFGTGISIQIKSHAPLSFPGSRKFTQNPVPVTDCGRDPCHVINRRSTAEQRCFSVGDSDSGNLPGRRDILQETVSVVPQFPETGGQMKRCSISPFRQLDIPHTECT